MTYGTANATDGAAKANEHTLTIERRRHAGITGVTDVLSFHETEIALKIDSGMMYITGEDLHVAKLLLDDGRLDVDGQIDGIVYETQKKMAKHVFGFKWLKK